jgi:DNA-binding transcriptional ArsR family regulator
MVTDKPVFDAISDPTRRAILDLLGERELAAGELAARFPASRPAISRHVRVLRRAGLVRERRSSQLRYYSLNRAPLGEVDRWLERHRVHWGAHLQERRRVVEVSEDSSAQADGG